MKDPTFWALLLLWIVGASYAGWREIVDVRQRRRRP
jgi:hypothetical protein